MIVQTLLNYTTISVLFIQKFRANTEGESDKNLR